MGKKDRNLNPIPFKVAEHRLGIGPNDTRSSLYIPRYYKDRRILTPEEQAARNAKVARLLGLPPVNQRKLRRPRS